MPSHQQVAKNEQRDAQGHFVAKPTSPSGPMSSHPDPAPAGEGSHRLSSRSSDPPLVSFQITNPITYLKLFWKRVMGQEGIDVHFRIHPVTAMLITGMIATGSFAVGRLTLPAPIIKYLPQLAPSPTPNPWHEAAYTGTLKIINTKYFLSTGEGESISLQVPLQVNLQKLIGKRILAIGSYNPQTKILRITDATDMEVLPTQIVPIPTTNPSPSTSM